MKMSREKTRPGGPGAARGVLPSPVSRRRFLARLGLALGGATLVPPLAAAAARWARVAPHAVRPASRVGWPGFEAMRRRRRSAQELAHLDLEAPHDLAG